LRTFQRYQEKSVESTAIAPSAVFAGQLP